MSPFATLLERYRERLDLSRNELARAIGCDPSHISRLERDERQPPRRDMVLALTEALRLTPEEGDRFLLAAGFAPTWMQVLAGVAYITPRGFARDG